MFTIRTLMVVGMVLALTVSAQAQGKKRPGGKNHATAGAHKPAVKPQGMKGDRVADGTEFDDDWLAPTVRKAPPKTATPFSLNYKKWIAGAQGRAQSAPAPKGGEPKASSNGPTLVPVADRKLFKNAKGAAPRTPSSKTSSGSPKSGSPAGYTDDNGAPSQVGIAAKSGSRAPFIYYEDEMAIAAKSGSRAPIRRAPGNRYRTTAAGVGNAAKSVSRAALKPLTAADAKVEIAAKSGSRAVKQGGEVAMEEIGLQTKPANVKSALPTALSSSVLGPAPTPRSSMVTAAKPPLQNQGLFGNLRKLPNGNGGQGGPPAPFPVKEAAKERFMEQFFQRHPDGGEWREEVPAPVPLKERIKERLKDGKGKN